MPATEPLCHLVDVNAAKLIKEGNVTLEIELFTRICEELKKDFKKNIWKMLNDRSDRVIVNNKQS